MTKDQKAAWAAKVVACLYPNDKLRGEFMQAYNNGPAAINDFLTTELGMPKELADEISANKGLDLSNYIGQLVCDYLW